MEHMNGEVVVKEGAEGMCAFYSFLDQIALDVQCGHHLDHVVLALQAAKSTE